MMPDGLRAGRRKLDGSEYFFPLKVIQRKTSRVGRLSYAGISSTADVQGSALCPGSTPGAPLEKQEREVSLNDGKAKTICR